MCLEMTALTLALLASASFLAGFFDAAVGGGGLVTVPSLIAALPVTTPFPVILGTNKVVACIGNSFATWRFNRAGLFELRRVLVGMVCSALGAALGVSLAYRASSSFMRPFTLVLLISILLFTFRTPSLGHEYRARFTKAVEQRWLACLAFMLGLYDGFFGPGSGSLLIFFLVVGFGFDFLRASAWAKVLNLASQLMSVALFVSRGSWIPSVAFSMAAANALGGYCGARAAIKLGTRFVRGCF